MSHTPKILDGAAVRDVLRHGMKEALGHLLAFDPTVPRPGLLIIQVGDKKESATYIRIKKTYGEYVGVRVEHAHLPAESTFEDVVSVIEKANSDGATHGIILQLPLPAHLHDATSRIIDRISPAKDVDGLTSTSTALLHAGKPGFVPATAKGVMSLLDFYGIECAGKKVVVMGRSALVGSPIGHLLKARGAEVAVVHSATKNPTAITQTADILIVAIGKPHLVDDRYVKPGQVVVDVGITVNEDKRIEGDVDVASVAGIVAHYSPVPGGVGPLTVASLFENVFQAYQNLIQ
jgi:methylenetetrahydrofolate dehydrogenase (NADP+)/methenyltetrahydrofolate cyclohydrolase